MCLPRPCAITKEGMIQNKVYETGAHIFLAIDDPQFKMCWCIFHASCVCICVIRSSWSHILSAGVIPKIFFHTITFVMPELTMSLYNLSEMILGVYENSFDYAQFTVVLEVLMSL